MTTLPSNLFNYSQTSNKLKILGTDVKEYDTYMKSDASIEFSRRKVKEISTPIGFELFSKMKEFSIKPQLMPNIPTYLHTPLNYLSDELVLKLSNGFGKTSQSAFKLQLQQDLYKFMSIKEIKLDFKKRGQVTQMLWDYLENFISKINSDLLPTYNVTLKSESLEFIGHPCLDTLAGSLKDPLLLNARTIKLFRMLEFMCSLRSFLIDDTKNQLVFDNYTVDKFEFGYTISSIDLYIYINYSYMLIKCLDQDKWDICPNTGIDFFVTLITQAINLQLLELQETKGDPISFWNLLLEEVRLSKIDWNKKVKLMATTEQLFLSCIDVRLGSIKNAWINSIVTIGAALGKTQRTTITVFNEIVDMFFWPHERNSTILSGVKKSYKRILSILYIMCERFDPHEVMTISGLHKCFFSSYINTEMSFREYISKQEERVVPKPKFLKEVTLLLRYQGLLYYYNKYHDFPKMLGDKSQVSMIQLLFRSRNNEVIKADLHLLDGVLIYNLFDRKIPDSPMFFINDKKICLQVPQRDKVTTDEISFVLNNPDQFMELTPVEILFDKKILNKDLPPEDQIDKLVIKNVDGWNDDFDSTYSGLYAKLASKEFEQKSEVSRLFGICSFEMKKSGTMVQELVKLASKVQKDSNTMAISRQDVVANMQSDSRLLDESSDKISIMADIMRHNIAMNVQNTTEYWGELGRWFNYTDWNYMPLYFNKMKLMFESDSNGDRYVVSGINSGIEGMQVYFWGMFTCSVNELCFRYFTSGITVQSIRVNNDDLYNILQLTDCATESSALIELKKVFLDGGLMIKASQTRISRKSITLLRMHYLQGCKVDNYYKPTVSICPLTSSNLTDLGLMVKSIISGVQSAMSLSSQPRTINRIKLVYIQFLIRALLVPQIPLEVLEKFIDNYDVITMLRFSRTWDLTLKEVSQVISPDFLFLWMQNLLKINSDKLRPDQIITIDSNLPKDIKNNLEKIIQDKNIRAIAHKDLSHFYKVRKQHKDKIDESLHNHVIFVLLMYVPETLGGLGVPMIHEMFLSGSEENLFGKLWNLERLAINLKFEHSMLNILEKRTFTEEDKFEREVLSTKYPGIVKTRTVQSEINRHVHDAFRKKWRGSPTGMNPEDEDELCKQIVDLNRANFSYAICSKFFELSGVNFIKRMLSQVANATSLLGTIKEDKKGNIKKLHNHTIANCLTFLNKDFSLQCIYKSISEFERAFNELFKEIYAQYGLINNDPKFPLAHYSLEANYYDGFIEVGRTMTDHNNPVKTFTSVRPKFDETKDLCVAGGDTWFVDIILNIVRYGKWIIMKSNSQKELKDEENNITETVDLILEFYGKNLLYVNIAPYVWAPETGQIYHRMDNYNHKTSVKFSGLNYQLHNLTSSVNLNILNGKYGDDHNINVSLLEGTAVVCFCLLKCYDPSGFGSGLYFEISERNIQDVSQHNFLCPVEKYVGTRAIQYNYEHVNDVDIKFHGLHGFGGTIDQTLQVDYRHGKIPIMEDNSKLSFTIALFQLYLNYKRELGDLMPHPELLNLKLVEEMMKKLPRKYGYTTGFGKETLQNFYKTNSSIYKYEGDETWSKVKRTILYNVRKEKGIKMKMFYLNYLSSIPWFTTEENSGIRLHGLDLGLTTANLNISLSYNKILPSVTCHVRTLLKDIHAISEAINNYVLKNPCLIQYQNTAFEYMSITDEKYTTEIPIAVINKRTHHGSYYDALKHNRMIQEIRYSNISQFLVNVSAGRTSRQSHTGSGAFHAQYHLLRFLLKNKYIKANTKILDLCAGRGDGKAAAQALRLTRYYAYSRGDIWDKMFHYDGLFYKPDLDAMNVNTYPIMWDTVDIILLDLSFQKGFVDELVSTFKVLLAKKKTIIFRESLLTEDLINYLNEPLRDLSFIVLSPSELNTFPLPYRYVIVTKSKKYNNIPLGDVYNQEQEIRCCQKALRSVYSHMKVTPYKIDKEKVQYINQDNLIDILETSNLTKMYKTQYIMHSTIDSAYIENHGKFPFLISLENYQKHKQLYQKNYCVVINTDRSSGFRDVDMTLSMELYVKCRNSQNDIGFSITDIAQSYLIDNKLFCAAVQFQQNSVLKDPLVTPLIKPLKDYNTLEIRNVINIHPLKHVLPKPFYRSYQYEAVQQQDQECKINSNDLYNMIGMILFEHQVTDKDYFNHLFLSMLTKEVSKKMNFEARTKKGKMVVDLRLKELGGNVGYRLCTKMVRRQVYYTESLSSISMDVRRLQQLQRLYVDYKPHIIGIYYSLDGPGQQQVRKVVRQKGFRLDPNQFNDRVLREKIIDYRLNCFNSVHDHTTLDTIDGVKSADFSEKETQEILQIIDNMIPEVNQMESINRGEGTTNDLCNLDLDDIYEIIDKDPDTIRDEYEVLDINNDTTKSWVDQLILDFKNKQLHCASTLEDTDLFDILVQKFNVPNRSFFKLFECLVLFFDKIPELVDVKVLDLGCSIGGWRKFLLDYCKLPEDNYVGIDSSSHLNVPFEYIVDDVTGSKFFENHKQFNIVLSDIALANYDQTLEICKIILMNFHKCVTKKFLLIMKIFKSDFEELHPLISQEFKWMRFNCISSRESSTEQYLIVHNYILE